MVQVVVDLQTPAGDGSIHGDNAAAAKHIHQCLVVGRQQHLDGPHETYIRKNIATAKVNWKYDPRPVDGKPASNTASAELYYHMFYDPVIYQWIFLKLM